MIFRPQLLRPERYLAFTSVVVGWLLLTTVITRAGDTIAPGINVYDGFETPELSKLWSTDRFAAGAVMSETNIVRGGNRAVIITVHTHDKFEAGMNGNSDSERAELMESKRLVSRENANYEQSFSMFIPTNFPIVPTRLVIAQWKQYCPDGGNCADNSPVLAIRYMSGVLRITQDIDKKYRVLYEEKNEFRGRWLDFKFQVRFSSSAGGRLMAWLDDKQILDYKGITANPENEVTGYPNPSYFYFKMGLYRNVMADPMSIYVDEYRKRQLPNTTLEPFERVGNE